jgi:hypothetical protein
MRMLGVSEMWLQCSFRFRELVANVILSSGRSDYFTGTRC